MARRIVLMAALALLLVPAGVLTALRLGEPRWVLAVQLVAFTPAALLLYAVALVVLVVLALRASPRGVRAGWTATAVVVAAALGLHATWFAPHVAGAEPAAVDEDAPAYTVMTANLLRGDGSVPDVLRAAREAQADLVVLSEATGRTVRALARQRVEETWPHRVGSAGRDIEGTVVLSRAPVRDVRPLSTSLGSWAFTVEHDHRDLEVLAVHPIAPYDGTTGWDADHRTILEAVRAREPDVVLGDFNATMDHRPMRRLGEAGLRTATEVAGEGWRPTWPVNGLFSIGPVPLPRSAEIDHVLVDDDAVDVVGTTRHRVARTDHLALAADLRLR